VFSVRYERRLKKHFLLWKDGVRGEGWAANVEGAECDSLVGYKYSDKGDEETWSNA